MHSLEALNQEIGEGANFRRKVATARIHDVDGQWRRLEPAQDGLQPAGAHVGADDEIGLARDARALGRERLEKAAAVRVDGAADAHLALVALPIAERPDVARRRVLVREAGMLREILRLVRFAVPLEVGRRGAADEPRGADPAADEILAARIADAHREVEALLDEIDHALGELDVELQLRMPGGEGRDGRRQMTRAEGRRAREAQRAAGRNRPGGHRDLGLLEVGEQLHAALVERLPGLRQRQPARRAVQEPHVEVRLEVPDLA